MTVKRLGKGLGALIPQDTEESSFLQRITEIPIDKIRPNPHQPRKQFPVDSLRELMLSIQENGIIQPITVRKANGYYEIIAGERRWRACKELNMNAIPAYVLHVDSDEEMMEIALIENIQRDDLNPLEQAVAFKTLIDKYGLSQENLGEKIGKNRATIANTMRLLKLPVSVQEAIKEDRLTAGHARALLSLEDEDLIRSVCDKIIQQGLSVRQVEALVQGLNAGKKKEPVKNHKKVTPGSSPHIQAIEEKLMTLMGTKVRLKTRADGKSGKVEIEFYSREDLQRILEIFESINL